MNVQSVMVDISKPAVLVTGATGFVGSHLVEALLRKGYPVACLVRSASDTSALQRMPVRLLTADLQNTEVLRNEIGGIRTVYHVAGVIKAANREEYFRINQIGTRHLLETLAKNSSITRFVHVSSLSAAGPSPEGRELDEGDTPNPISWYGESKLKSEQEVLKFGKKFQVTILRPSAVYGPRDRETILIFRMVKRGCLFTPGRFTRRFSLIHVNDLTAALILAGEHDSPSGEVFYISGGEAHTWEEVGRAIARELGKNFRRVAFPQWLAQAAGLAGDLWSGLSGRPATINSQKVRELLQPSWLCNSSKAQEFLEFHPEVDLENGIRDTILWYQHHGWL